MGNRRVFIGWNGLENQELARLISNRLSEHNFLSIIGGEWRQAFTVSEEIIHQMNGCDFAIFLIEKETRRNKSDEIISMGFNPNVMMELGYMLRKVKDHNRIRRILINMEHSELPSDLQGMWSVSVEKRTYSADNEEERCAALSETADKIADDFFNYMKDYQNTNKLDYFDNWEENVMDIYRYTGDIRIADKLLYGMQAAIYSGEYERLFKKLVHIHDEHLSKKDRFGDLGAVRCALAILNVFIVSHRLTKPLNDEEFDDMCDALETEFEKGIKDNDLKAWCKIFRKDKLELSYELYATGLDDVETKKEFLYESLNLCFEILSMIDEQVGDSDGGNGEVRDEKYALIYKAFTNRNISQIHKQLAELEPEKSDEHKLLEEEYCAKTLAVRRELYDYYKDNAKENILTFDFVTQEYILALSEQCKFDKNPVIKNKNIRTANKIYRAWQERNKIRTMIFDKVSDELSGFIDPK